MLTAWHVRQRWQRLPKRWHYELCVEGNATKLVEGLDVGGTVWKGTDGASVSYHCGKLIYGQAKLSALLHVMTNAQVEAPGHGKWWLNGKTGLDKRFCQQCMCSIVTPEAPKSGNQMLSTKWIERGGADAIAVSPAVKCVCLLSNPARVSSIKGKGMRAKRKGKALVERNDYVTYTMDDVPPLPDYKVILPKSNFSGLRAHYNIRTDPDLGIGFAALHRVACGHGLCKEQLARPWVLPCVDVDTQPRYGQNKECPLWPSYEGGNDWKICQLVPKTEADKKGVWELHHCVLSAMEACMSLMVREGKVGAYYVVK